MDRGAVGALRRWPPRGVFARAPHARLGPHGRRDAGQIAPLRDNPGTVRLISQIAEALLPEIAAPAVLGRREAEPDGESERVVFAWCALMPTCSPRAASSRLRRLRPSWRALSGMAPPRARASSPCAMFPVCPAT
ncbi:MAG: hypothetical protein ACLTSX_07915 [Collinsella sp.]